MRDAWRARQAAANALFQERCKKAGEFIHRTAENVEGVYLLKVRPEKINYGDQYKMDDPYGHDTTGENFLKGLLPRPIPPNQPSSREVEAEYSGYRYVDADDPADGKRYRYTGSMKEVTHTTSILMGGDGKTTFKTMDFVLDKTLAPDPAPRYGVTYDDISTKEERD